MVPRGQIQPQKNRPHTKVKTKVIKAKRKEAKKTWEAKNVVKASRGSK